MLKRCNKCGEQKEFSEFYRKAEHLTRPNASGVSAYSAECKPCTRARRERYVRENKDAVKNTELKATFGITLTEYNEMFLAQDGCCAICEKHAIFDTRKLSVDHCHETGKIRGLLCSTCNTALGKFRDSPEILSNAIAYLERSKFVVIAGGSDDKTKPMA